MTTAYIVDAVRTPVGKRGGSLAAIHPADLGAHVLSTLVERTGIELKRIAPLLWRMEADGLVLHEGRRWFTLTEPETT